MEKLKNIKNRVAVYDIARCIAVLSIIQHHIGEFPYLSIVDIYFFAITIPFLFFLSGYSYKDKGYSIARNIKYRLWKTIKDTLILFFLLMIIYFPYYSLSHTDTLNVMLRTSIWFFSFASANLLPNIFGSFEDISVWTPFFIFWFIHYYIIANFVFAILVNFALKNLRSFFCCFSLILASTLFFIEFAPILSFIYSPLLCASSMLLGACLRKNKFFEKKSSNFIWIINFIVSLIFVWIYMTCIPSDSFHACLPYGQITEGYTTVFTFNIVAIIGFYTLLCVSKIIEKIPLVSKYFAFLGRNTMVLFVLHFQIIQYVKSILDFPNDVISKEVGNVIIFVIVLFILSIIAYFWEIIHNKIKEAKRKNMLS